MAQNLRPYSVDLLRADGSLRFSTCPVFAINRKDAIREAQLRSADLGISSDETQKAFVFLGLTTNGTLHMLRASV